MAIKNKEEISFYTKLSEIVKIEATMFSIITLAFSIFINTISYYNRLVFDLKAQGTQVKAFVPYHEIMNLFTTFIVIGVLSLVCGILAIYMDDKKQKSLGITSIFLFFLGLCVFGYTIYTYRLTFYFY